MLIMFRCFFRAPRREASISAAPRRILRTRDDKAIFREPLEHQLDQFPVVRRDHPRFKTRDKIHGRVHRHQIQIEITGPASGADALKGQIESYGQETRQLEDRLRNKTDEARALSDQVADERIKAEQFETRVGELDRQLKAQMTEAEVLGRRVEELTARLDEQSRFLADREFASDRLHAEAAKAKQVEAELRAALGETDGRHRAATETIRAERASIEEQLNHSEEERAKLQREIAAMKHEAENTWATERMENALLRERINDVAAEVARLTATLEGPASPIASILADGTGRSAQDSTGSNGGAVPIAPEAGESKGTLADRIRALQSRASQLPQTSGA